MADSRAAGSAPAAKSGSAGRWVAWNRKRRKFNDTSRENIEDHEEGRFMPDRNFDERGQCQPSPERPPPDAVAPRIYCVVIETASTAGESQAFHVWLDGALLVISRDPEHAACRALLQRGLTGPLITRWRGSPHEAMRLDIESGAQRAIAEGRRQAPANVRHREFNRAFTEAPNDAT